jgi:tetratricopeptide (TPR) repeat protein
MIEEGRAALRAGDASRAHDAFERALEETESGDALEGLGLALYLQRVYAGAIAQHERAYAAYRREGQTVAAARAARTLAWITGNVLGDWASGG